MRSRECLFQLFKLKTGEGGSIPPLLPLRSKVISIVAVCGPWWQALGGGLISSGQLGGRSGGIIFGRFRNAHVVLISLLVRVVVWK